MKSSLTHISHRLGTSRWMVLLVLLGGLCIPAIARAEVKLPQVFGSHMVLQQDKPLSIWGWAAPGESIKVQLGSTSQTTQANERGEWKVVLPVMEAGGPFTLIVSGSNTITFEDVMIGEVWLCSGQSNMEMGIGMVNNGKEENRPRQSSGHPPAHGGQQLGAAAAEAT